MKKMHLTMLVAIVALACMPMTLMAKKAGLEITTCTCSLGNDDCDEIVFTSPTMDGLHVHGTRERDNGIDPACHNQVESNPIECTGPVNDLYTCTTDIDGLTPAVSGCPSEPYDDTIVVKVAADADVDHGNAARYLKDNMVCESELVDAG